MNAYLLLRQVHGASAVVAILLALAVALLGWWWRGRAAAHMRKATALDRATTFAMLATMLTGVGIASWGGWWPLGWVRLSMGASSWCWRWIPRRCSRETGPYPSCAGTAAPLRCWGCWC